ncbi:hypothetical protein ACFVTC_42155 [Streptomyces sp. NPDC057950]|uniref:hypothetical protein n=1 Tax=Streptomyces sp. NPDC057950 TaxID=3346288 RepID=UPI0036E12E2F
MSALRRQALARPGDRVRFDGQLHTVVGLSGVLVRLVDQLGRISAMHLPRLMTLEGFEVAGSGGPAPGLPAGLLDGVAAEQAERTLWWHRHMAEVLIGLPPDAQAGAVPKAEFDPATQTLTQREAAKAVELSAETGRRISPHTVRWRRRRYQQQGVLAAPRRQAARQVDPRVVGVLGS